MDEQKLTNQLAQKFPDVEHSVNERPDTIYVGMVRVPEDRRGQGIGTQFMNHIIDYSRSTKKPVFLTPENVGGQSTASLDRWYKSLGFKPNKGRSKDYRSTASRVREPKADGGNVDGITAYHGSPHDFEQFDTSKIGTGEGAQAYGHGLYFAEHEPVAKGYRDALAQTRNPTTSINELIEQMSKNSPQSRTHKNIQWYMKQDPMLVKHVGDEDIVQHIHDALNGQNTDGTVSESALDAYGKLTDKLGRDHKGHMYEVHINAHPHHMLDWDKPLREQHEKIRRLAGWPAEHEAAHRAAEKVDNDNLHAALEGNGDYTPAKLPPRPHGALPLSATGADIYEHIKNKMGAIDWPIDADRETREQYRKSASERASQYLLKHGIKGIKYLDAGSRGDKAEPTHNYVVFDHNDVRVKRKYERGGRVRFSQGGTDSYDYRGEHQAPGPEDGAPLHDLTKVYPDDVYGPNGFRYYGETGDPSDRTNFSLVQSMRGKPNASVTMYRAVPNVPSVAKELAKLEEDMANYQRRGRLPRDAWTTDKNRWYDSSAHQRDLLREKAEKEKLNPPKEIGINAGDWVTTSRQYAKDHGESALNGNYKILTKKAKAKELFTAGDSHHEWGYHPEKKAEGGTVNGYEDGGEVGHRVHFPSLSAVYD